MELNLPHSVTVNKKSAMASSQQDNPFSAAFLGLSVVCALGAVIAYLVYAGSGYTVSGYTVSDYVGAVAQGLGRLLGA